MMLFTPTGGTVSEQSMPELFARLTEKVGQMADEPAPEPYELSSDRMVVGGDDMARVDVVMEGFHLKSISYDPYWIAREKPTPRQMAEVTVTAVNQVIDKFFAEEVADLEAHKVPMGELYTGLKKFSEEFSAAFEKAMARLDRTN